MAETFVHSHPPTSYPSFCTCTLENPPPSGQADLWHLFCPMGCEHQGGVLLQGSSLKCWFKTLQHFLTLHHDYGGTRVPKGAVTEGEPVAAWTPQPPWRTSPRSVTRPTANFLYEATETWRSVCYLSITEPILTVSKCGLFCYSEG